VVSNRKWSAIILFRRQRIGEILWCHLGGDARSLFGDRECANQLGTSRIETKKEMLTAESSWAAV
jgi:hypothetical protein